MEEIIKTLNCYSLVLKEIIDIYYDEIYGLYQEKAEGNTTHLQTKTAKTLNDMDPLLISENTSYYMTSYPLIIQSAEYLRSKIDEIVQYKGLGILSILDTQLYRDTINMNEDMVSTFRQNSFNWTKDSYIKTIQENYGVNEDDLFYIITNRLLSESEKVLERWEKLEGQRGNTNIALFTPGFIGKLKKCSK